MPVQFKRLPHGEFLPIPSRATDGASGLDLQAAVSGWIMPGQTEIVLTGFAVAIPQGYEGQIRPRSGLAAKHGVTVLNSPGTIDSDYRGEVRVILINHGNDVFVFERGDRIAQLVIAEVAPIGAMEVDALSETLRGEGGFGSTGV